MLAMGVSVGDHLKGVVWPREKPCCSFEVWKVVLVNSVMRWLLCRSVCWGGWVGGGASWTWLLTVGLGSLWARFLPFGLEWAWVIWWSGTVCLLPKEEDSCRSTLCVVVCSVGMGVVPVVNES